MTFNGRKKCGRGGRGISGFELSAFPGNFLFFFLIDSSNVGTGYRFRDWFLFHFELLGFLFQAVLLWKFLNLNIPVTPVRIHFFLFPPSNFSFYKFSNDFYSSGFYHILYSQYFTVNLNFIIFKRLNSSLNSFVFLCCIFFFF